MGALCLFYVYKFFFNVSQFHWVTKAIEVSLHHARTTSLKFSSNPTFRGRNSV